jgi:hypothetical protein
MIDFPASPTNGQKFNAAGLTWVWDGAKWTVASGLIGGVTIGDTPPASPVAGALWWDSVGGQLYVFYNDGNSSQWAPTTNQIGNGGVTDGSNAPAGVVGEVLSAIVTTPVSIPTATNVNVATLPLTAGDWDVQGEIWFTLAGATYTGASLAANISTTSAVAPVAPTVSGSRGVVYATFATGQVPAVQLKPCRLSFASAASAYLIASAGFSVGSCTAVGVIWARRAR